MRSSALLSIHDEHAIPLVAFPATRGQQGGPDVLFLPGGDLFAGAAGQPPDAGRAAEPGLVMSRAARRDLKILTCRVTPHQNTE